jgi:hypothetical protein
VAFAHTSTNPTSETVHLANTVEKRKCRRCHPSDCLGALAGVGGPDVSRLGGDLATDAVDQLAARPIPTLRRARAAGEPLGTDVGLLREPIGDVLIWISVVGSDSTLHGWYRLLPLFYPDSDGLTVEIGEFVDNPVTSLVRPRTWSRDDHDVVKRLGDLIELELPLVVDRFERASTWADNAIPDEHDHEEFRDLVESIAYARFLSGSLDQAVRILGNLSTGEDTIAARSREMLGIMQSEPERAHQRLADWRAWRLARLGPLERT